MCFRWESVFKLQFRFTLRKTNPPLIERIWQRANFKCVYTVKYTVKRPSGLERLYSNTFFNMYISA